MSQGMNNILMQAVLIVPLFLIMGWMFWSQKKKSKAVKEMIDNIKPGVFIKTIGGFYGKVVSVKEDVVTFECGPDKAKLVLDKSAIATVENSEVSNEAIDEKK